MNFNSISLYQLYQSEKRYDYSHVGITVIKYKIYQNLDKKTSNKTYKKYKLT